MQVQAAAAAALTAAPFTSDCGSASGQCKNLPSNLVISPCGVVKQINESTAQLAAQNTRIYLTKEIEWKDLHRTAYQSILQRNYKYAATLWLEALDLLKFTPYTDFRLQETLDCLVETYQMLNNHEEAARYCMRSLEVKRVAYDNFDVRVADCLNELAGIYYSSQQYGKVEILCLEAEQIYLKLEGAISKKMGTIATNLAFLYHAQSKIGHARKRYLQALKIKKALLPEGHPQLLDLYGRYGRLLSTMGFD